MILVVGGSSGVGLHVLKKLCDRDIPVFNASRNKPPLSATNLIHFDVDVTKRETIAELFSQIQKHECAGLKQVVYCSGISTPPSKISDFDTERFLDAVRVNAAGFGEVLKKSLPFLIDGITRILAVGSIATHGVSRYSGPEYTASKMALSGLVRHFALELASRNINVNVIYPGPVDTPMLRERLSVEQIEQIKNSVPNGRLADLETISNLMMFLLSAENQHITGAGFDINGGSFLSA